MYKLLFLLLLVGCSNNEPNVTIVNKFYEYDVIVIDSCEYLVFGRDGFDRHGNSHILTHKGNCKNPTHHK